SAATVSWLAVFDAATGGNCLTRRALTATVAIAAGVDVSVDIANLTIQLTRLVDKLTLTPPVHVTKVIFLTTTGAGTWTVPADWNSANNTIEVIGGGGGQGAISGSYSSGGGGGAYSQISNLTLTSGASVNFTVGAGGTSNFGSAGGDGGD